MCIRDSINTVHEGQKKHKCDQCEKSFSQIGNLKKHYNHVHKGLKNHLCDLCGQAFSEPGRLKLHINNVHLGLENIKDIKNHEIRKIDNTSDPEN